MPPHVPRKRKSPPTQRSELSTQKAKIKSGSKTVKSTKRPAHEEERREFLNQLESSASESSSISDAPSSSDIAASPAKRRKLNEPKRENNTVSESSDLDDSGSDAGVAGDEDGWDSFVAQHDETATDRKANSKDAQHDHIEITIDKAAQVRNSDFKALNDKKGPTKIERHIRNSTHQMHVMALMYHNYIRNHWINEKELQSSLAKQLSDGCKDEIDRWRKACGDRLDMQDMISPEKAPQNKHGDMAKDRKRTARGKQQNYNTANNIRDWGPKSQETKNGVPNLSHGDPTLRLLKALSAFWRKRFNKTAPGLRKHGYKEMERIQDELRAYRQNPKNERDFGERIESLQYFKRLAEKAEGSRDVGAQLFTALLRGLGMKARMVVSLQPAGFGWSKAEEAGPVKRKGKPNPATAIEDPKKSSPPTGAVRRPKKSIKEEDTSAKKRSKRHSKGNSSGRQHQPISVSDDEDSPLSEPPISDSEESVVDITRSRPPQQSNRRFDGDLQYPHYWTEVLSPISNTWIPVDPMVLSVVANNLDSHAVFEPRGAGADRTKQVLAYVVAFNPDRSAKDVTTRYLKRHMWPGKTKGVRYPLERIPLYNKKGKIIKYHQYDWFTDLMRLYTPREGFNSAADEVEDERELKPVHPQRNTTDSGKEPKESLQYYKSSAEFVLERHLRREEALLPLAQPVKIFRVGKGDKAVDEPVFKRSDVVTTKSSESWHKEGRQVKVGEQPLKRVPMRAVTAIRKAEIEQTERETGQKAQQALFSHDQTEWIIPPPIEDGVIPKNSFGNIDLYVPTMLPEGASHVPLRGTAKICKKLGIDFAEACTGFEFGNKMAVPILTGVVVAQENRKLVQDAWREEDQAKREREKKKQERLALGMWRKLLAGLRVIERVRAEYGIVDERKLHQEMEQEIKGKGGRGKKGKTQTDAIDLDEEDVEFPQQPTMGFPQASDSMGGGFLREGVDAEIVDKPRRDEVGGGFIIEDDNATPKPSALPNGTGKPMKSLREQAEQVDDDFEQSNNSSEHPGGQAMEIDGIEWSASQEGVMEAKPKVVPAKKRGRPSKGSGSGKQAVKAANTTGKNCGRPKKSPQPLIAEDEHGPDSDEGASDLSEAAEESGESDEYEEP